MSTVITTPSTTTVEQSLQFTKEEILTLRRALNALATRHQLSLLTSSDSMRAELEAGLAAFHELDSKLLSIKPCSSPES